MYTEDNDAYYPASGFNTSRVDYGWSWDDKLSDYDGRQLSNADKKLWGFGLTTDLGEKAKLYLCSSDSRGNASALNITARSYSLTMLYNFTTQVGRGITSDPWKTDESLIYSRKQTDINGASQSIAMAENSHSNNSVGHYSRSTMTVVNVQDEQDNRSYWSHDWWKSNYLFVDGHASYTYFPATYVGSNLDPWSSADNRGTMWDSGK